MPARPLPALTSTRLTRQGTGTPSFVPAPFVMWSLPGFAVIDFVPIHLHVMWSLPGFCVGPGAVRVPPVQEYVATPANDEKLRQ